MHTQEPSWHVILGARFCSGTRGHASTGLPQRNEGSEVQPSQSRTQHSTRPQQQQLSCRMLLSENTIFSCFSILTFQKYYPHNTFSGKKTVKSLSLTLQTVKQWDCLCPFSVMTVSSDWWFPGYHCHFQPLVLLRARHSIISLEQFTSLSSPWIRVWLHNLF